MAEAIGASFDRRQACWWRVPCNMLITMGNATRWRHQQVDGERDSFLSILSLPGLLLVRAVQEPTRRLWRLIPELLTGTFKNTGAIKCGRIARTKLAILSLQS